MEKSASNLVTVTWKNDEVRMFTGKGHSGMQIHKQWYEQTPAGKKLLIGNHNTYGGDYWDNRVEKWFKPWFWGEASCRKLAFDAMNLSAECWRQRKREFYVGDSAPGGCERTGG